MMRKLVVTVFALSFVTLGCGSDNGTKIPDAGKDMVQQDTNPGAEPQVVPDVPMGAEVAAETGKDQAMTPDGQEGIDQSPLIDQAAPIDSENAMDVQAPDAPAVDGGTPAVDAQPGIDTGTVVDTHGVDGGATG